MPGAFRSRARACRLREALKVYALPPEIIVVISAALTMEGKMGILSLVIEITLQDEQCTHWLGTLFGLLW
jgi:hypothetical protein